MLLRHYLEQGTSKAELARKFGVSQRTVYHWIETDQLDRELDDQPVKYGPRVAVDRKIDSYRDLITTRLKAYPKLTATRLFESWTRTCSCGPGGNTSMMRSIDSAALLV